MLSDISYGRCTDAVRRFVVKSYVRGACFPCAERCPLEKVTSVFTKRRYRDAWNRALVRKIAKTHNHSMKACGLAAMAHEFALHPGCLRKAALKLATQVRGMVRARGQRGSNWYSEKKVDHIRRNVRTQNLWQLHLAGDWFPSYETKDTLADHHLMRAMITSNVAVDCRFANGTQGRVMMWHPEAPNEKKKQLPASFHNLHVRVAKETSLNKQELLPDVDQMDIHARQENLPCRGDPILLQVSLVPAYVRSDKTSSVPIDACDCARVMFAHNRR